MSTVEPQLINSVIAASPHQVCCDLKREAIILNLKSGKYYGLDDVGARVWALIQQPRSVSEIRDILMSEFHVEPAVCELDLITLVRSLVNSGLVDIQV